MFCAVTIVTLWAYGPLQTSGFVYEDRNPNSTIDLKTEVDNRGPWAGWTIERAALEPAPRMLSNLTMRMQGWARASARGYHLANVLIHGVNGLLLFAVVLPFGSSAALMATCLFLLHPINHEAVSYVSARPDLLYATAVLLMLLASEMDGWLGVIGCTLAGILAVSAKESAIVVIGLLPLWLILRGRWSARWWGPLIIWTCGAVLVIYRLVHIGSEKAVHPWGAIAAYTSDAAHGVVGYAATQSAALWRLLALIVWPFGFSVDHDFDIVPIWLSVMALISVAGLAIAAWRGRHTVPLAAFAVTWLLTALAIRFVLPMPEYLHEQHLYVPLIGVWIAFGASLKADDHAIEEPYARSTSAL